MNSQSLTPAYIVSFIAIALSVLTIFLFVISFLCGSGGTKINDTQISTDEVWSSSKTNNSIQSLINDRTSSSTTTFSSSLITSTLTNVNNSLTQINTQLDNKIPYSAIQDTQTGEKLLWSSDKINNEIDLLIPKTDIRDEEISSSALWTSSQITNYFKDNNGISVNDELTTFNNLWTASKTNSAIVDAVNDNQHVFFVENITPDALPSSFEQGITIGSSTEMWSFSDGTTSNNVLVLVNKFSDAHTIQTVLAVNDIYYRMSTSPTDGWTEFFRVLNSDSIVKESETNNEDDDNYIWSAAKTYKHVFNGVVNGNIDIDSVNHVHIIPNVYDPINNPKGSLDPDVLISDYPFGISLYGSLGGIGVPLPGEKWKIQVADQLGGTTPVDVIYFNLVTFKDLPFRAFQILETKLDARMYIRSSTTSISTSGTEYVDSWGDWRMILEGTNIVKKGQTQNQNNDNYIWGARKLYDDHLYNGSIIASNFENDIHNVKHVYTIPQDPKFTPDKGPDNLTYYPHGISIYGSLAGQQWEIKVVNQLGETVTETISDVFTLTTFKYWNARCFQFLESRTTGRILIRSAEETAVNTWGPFREIIENGNDGLVKIFPLPKFPDTTPPADFPAGITIDITTPPTPPTPPTHPISDFATLVTFMPSKLDNRGFQLLDQKEDTNLTQPKLFIKSRKQDGNNTNLWGPWRKIIENTSVEAVKIYQAGTEKASDTSGTPLNFNNDSLPSSYNIGITVSELESSITNFGIVTTILQKNKKGYQLASYSSQPSPTLAAEDTYIRYTLSSSDGWTSWYKFTTTQENPPFIPITPLSENGLLFGNLVPSKLSEQDLLRNGEGTRIPNLDDLFAASEIIPNNTQKYNSPISYVPNKVCNITIDLSKDDINDMIIFNKGSKIRDIITITNDNKMCMNWKNAFPEEMKDSLICTATITRIQNNFSNWYINADAFDNSTFFIELYENDELYKWTAVKDIRLDIVVRCEVFDD